MVHFEEGRESVDVDRNKGSTLLTRIDIGYTQVFVLRNTEAVFNKKKKKWTKP